jgi:hypothetical protein
MRRERLSGGFAMGGVMAVLLALVAGGGCEVVVGDSLPGFTCVPGAPNTCPSDSICVPITHRCAPRAGTCLAMVCDTGLTCDPQSLACVAVAGDGDAGDDGGTRIDASTDGTLADATFGDASDGRVEGSTGVPESGEQPDVMGSDAPRSCSAVTCTCGGDPQCDSNMCSTQLLITDAVLSANDGLNFCIQGCCNSGDCPAGTVCFAPGTGGNYCVAPGLLGRSITPGEAIGGATCAANSDCRSGACVNKVCSDTCCSGTAGSSQCASGSVCHFGPFPGIPGSIDTHIAASCGTSGNIANNQPCVATLDTTCASGRCGTNGRCSQPCRTTSDCAAGQACAYVPGPGNNPNTDIVAACTPSTGSAPDGAACTLNADCQSNLCNGTLCSDVCFSDGDCKSPWKCHPDQFRLPFGGGSFDILSCHVQ